MNTSTLTVWWRLLWMFLKVNLLSPSGPASIGLLYDEAVGKIMSEERFVESVGLSNVLPGSEALKLALFVGYAAGGIPGIAAAVFGAILPPTVMMLIVAAILQHFQQDDWLTKVRLRDESGCFGLDGRGGLGAFPRRTFQKGHQTFDFHRRPEPDRPFAGRAVSPGATGGRRLGHIHLSLGLQACHST